MGFWIFMFIMALLVPAMMILFGLLFRKNAPKEINYVFGYRTSRSMKNQQTWQFSHNLLGRIWIVCGSISAVITTATMPFLIGKETDVIGVYGSIIIFVSLGLLLITIIPVEVALSKNFDKDGNPIKK